MGKVWEEEEVKLLIETIRKYEEIWNTKHPHYTLSKRIRHNLWKEITELFNESCGRHKFKPLELCHKWNNLRLSFENENKKICNSGLKSSQWKYFDMLKFLMAHPMKKHHINFSNRKQYSLRKSLKRETAGETEMVSIGSISPIAFRAKGGQNGSFSADKSTNIPVNSRERSESQSTFGDYIAAEMRHLEVDLQIAAKKKIFDVLMDLQYEQESRDRCKTQ